jgi:hypothetical protein
LFWVKDQAGSNSIMDGAQALAALVAADPLLSYSSSGIYRYFLSAFYIDMPARSPVKSKLG